MANISDYKFNNLTGTGNDACYLNESELQNKEYSAYMTSKFSGPINNAANLALSNNLLWYEGNNSVGSLGSSINESNSLLLGRQKDTHPETKLSLRERTFKSIPYLGRGKGNIDVESTLMHGEDHCENKKSLFPVSEQSYLEHSNYPLIKEIEETITNPKYLVEGSHNDWIRGGLPSRELNRDKAN